MLHTVFVIIFVLQTLSSFSTIIPSQKMMPGKDYICDNDMPEKIFN